MGEYLTVTELSREQIIELKQDYLFRYYQETADEEDGPSQAELSDADDIISDGMIFEAYESTLFTADDFFCTASI